MSLVSLSVARAHVPNNMEDEDLQLVIDAIEAAFARHLNGPLQGQRTETFYPVQPAKPLYLSRFTDAVTITEDGEAVASGDFRLIAGRLIRVDDRWTEPVAVTYTPNDESELIIAICDVLATRLIARDAQGLEYEQIGSYSRRWAAAAVKSPLDTDVQLRALARSLQPVPADNTARFTTVAAGTGYSTTGT